MGGPNDDPHAALSVPLLLVDPPREHFWPLAATRPAADLLAGTRSFRARWSERQGPLATLLCDEAVAGCAFRAGDPPSLNDPPRGAAGWRVAVATWIPPRRWSFGDEPAEYRCGGEPVAWRLDASRAEEIAGRIGGPSWGGSCSDATVGLDLPHVEVGGAYCESIWDTMAANPEILAWDAEDFEGGGTFRGVDPSVLLGDDLRLGEDVAIGPFVVLDAREGPIVLDRGAIVEPHAVLRGPLYVGPESRILGGEVGHGTSIGPRCKVRGEVEQTVFQGFANKAHDGFVGHSFVGEWANLGASTVTSDLKNTYGPVRVGGPEGRVDTGLLKVGAFLGDHVRTGIGTRLTTGARIGAGSHLFGGGVSPPYLPDFSWDDGAERVRVRLDAFLATAETAMRRRGHSPTEGERALWSRLQYLDHPTSS
jgi:carbonic anhydrase/acetyltransferase-like protein (isoleucine patch superfamily)